MISYALNCARKRTLVGSFPPAHTEGLPIDEPGIPFFAMLTIPLTISHLFALAV